MKFEVLQENIVAVCSDVYRFTGSKSSMPVLKGFKIEAKKSGLVLSATNMESSIVTKLGAKVDKVGELVVPAKLFLDFLQALPAGKVMMERVGESLVIKSKRMNAEITCMSMEDYPTIPSFEVKDKIKISLESLEKVVNLVVPAASVDLSRPVLTSVLLEVSKRGRVKAVSTDGYRLSRLGLGKLSSKTELPQLLVPARVFVEVYRVVKNLESESVEMGFSEEGKSIVFEFGQTLVMSQLTDGEFPNYKKILPTNFEVEIELDREEFLDAVRASLVFLSDDVHIIVLSIGEDVVVKSRGSELGRNEAQIQGNILTGEGGKIAFNGKFLSDFLRSSSSEKVILKMNSSLQPGMFTTDVKNFVHVIMPVRTQES